jgi:AraC-like DNA-binding protein
MICDSAVGGEFLAEEDTRVVSIAAPRHLIVPRFATREAMRRRASRPERTLASRLLWEMSVGLAREGASAARKSTVVNALGGLILLTLDDVTDNGRCSSEGRGQARLAAVRDYLRRHAGDPHLNPAAVAEEFHISRRYLHRLMATSGRTFQEELTATRLANAMACLRDPHHALRTVAAIAYDCGFNDLSQFNRRFRERYGCTPREVRPRAGRSAD